MQLLIPLGDKHSAEAVGEVVWPIATVAILLMWALAAPLTWVWFGNLNYTLEDDRIVLHKGIISRITQNIPYRAVTDFVLHRSPYDRILGIATIKVQTAGQSAASTGYEGNLYGLVAWEGLLEELRTAVRRARRESAAGMTGGSVLSEMDETDLLKAILAELQGLRKAMEKR